MLSYSILHSRRIIFIQETQNLLDKKQSISTCITQTNPKPLSGLRDVLDPKPLSDLWCVSAQLRSSHDRSFVPANGTSAITEPDTCLCKFNFGHYWTDRLPPANETSAKTELTTCLCKFNSGHHRTGCLPHANDTSAITEPATCLCKFNSSHHGTGRLPHANGAFDPTRAFDVSTLGSMLRCCACIYV
jgi:hypothetical protein